MVSKWDIKNYIKKNPDKFPYTYKEEEDALYDKETNEYLTSLDTFLDLYRKKSGESFESIYYDHVGLYNVLRCTECGTVIFTYEDESYDPYLKCPTCVGYNTHFDYWTKEDIEADKEKQSVIRHLHEETERQIEANERQKRRNGKYSNRWAFLNNSNSDKSVCMVANFTKGVPYNLLAQEIEFIDLSQYENVVVEENGNVIVDDKTIYLVLNGEIGYKDDLYPINLPDGYYIIRKLTVKECERLQTMPEGYVDGVISNSQAYKCLGNGWTAEIIIHILSYGLKDIPKDYPIEVLSMYDGIATGRYCLEKLGFTNITYKSYEVDKYAIQAAMKNYPDIIQYGDAFQLREDDWVY